MTISTLPPTSDGYKEKCKCRKPAWQEESYRTNIKNIHARFYHTIARMVYCLKCGIAYDEVIPLKKQKAKSK